MEKTASQKFNFDVLDRFYSYWDDISTKYLYCSKCRSEEGFDLQADFFKKKKKTALNSEFMKNTMKCVNYVFLFKKNHWRLVIKKWKKILCTNIKVLKWLSKLLDLENIWVLFFITKCSFPINLNKNLPR